MFVNTLSINHHLSQKLGLKQFQMKGLSQLVVMTGVNGCGKTRLLSSLDWLLHQAKRSGYERVKKKVERLNSPNSLLNSDPREFDGEPRSYHALIQHDTLELSLIEASTGVELSFQSGETEEESLKQYVELSDFLKRPLEHSQNNIARLSIGVPRKTADLSCIGLLSSPLSYLNDLCQRLNEERVFQEAEGELAFCTTNPGIEQQFLDLQKLTTDLATMNLDLHDHRACLNRIPLSEITLSDGQALLLRWVVLIHSGVLKEARVPLLLDEPELHLHPDALNRLFDLLILHAPNCQIWIATHSISLVAHLAAAFPRSVWFGKEGKFHNAGKDLPFVVEALLGGKGGSEQLVDYCVSAERFAFNSFATDCLMPPLTVQYKNGDPQISQVFEFIWEHQDLPINLLDFGAGQGRLLDGVVAEANSRAQIYSEFLSYYAFEPDNEARALCTQSVSTHYPDASARVFGSSESVKSDAISFDLIVMANLLHEILPTQWIPEIFRGQIITELLKESGSVLLIEDTLLPTGELAHNCGFLVLEQSALEKLFKVTDEDYSKKHFIKKSSHQNRLQATLIAKNLFERVDDGSMIEALDYQFKAAISEVRKLRQSNSQLSYMDGRRHAYLTQLATNITLALEDLGVPLKTAN